MSSTVAKVEMKPPHPGAFIREEILSRTASTSAREPMCLACVVRRSPTL